MTSSRVRNIIDHARKFGFLDDSIVTRGQQKCSVLDANSSPTSENSLTDPAVSVHDYGPFGSQMRKKFIGPVVEILSYVAGKYFSVVCCRFRTVNK